MPRVAVSCEVFASAAHLEDVSLPSEPFNGRLRTLRSWSLKVSPARISQIAFLSAVNVAPDATAFAHRSGTLYCIQYGSDWVSPSATPQRLAEMRTCYAAMRPYVSGACYVNYCDLEVTNWPTAYWGQNLDRLQKIKSAFDPENVFRHAQSIPTLGLAA